MNEHRWEVSLSAALDGELGRTETLELLDAMADDPGCREQWRRFRALERSLRPLRRPATTPLPRRRSRARAAWWLAPVAAAALVALMLLRPDDPPAGTFDGASLTVRLQEHEGRMTEARFVELVIEVLQAERRYQDKMREVLEEVRPRAALAEAGSPESAAPRAERIALGRSDEPSPAGAELPFEAVAGIH